MNKGLGTLKTHLAEPESDCDKSLTMLLFKLHHIPMRVKRVPLKMVAI